MEENDSSQRRFQKTNSLYWARKDLRLHDNPALREALLCCDTFRVVYILDTKSVEGSRIGLNLWRFLLQSLEELDNSLRKLKSRLFVVRGQPADVLPKLFLEWNITKLTFGEDTDPFGKERDSAIQMLAREAGIDVIVRQSNTLYDWPELIYQNGGKLTCSYKSFLNVIQTMAPPDLPEETITCNSPGLGYTPLDEDCFDKYEVPSFEELGLDSSKLCTEAWHGGEIEALNRLNRHLERKAWIASFEHPKITPNSLHAMAHSVSPYLRFGCLSPRLFYSRLTDLYEKVKRRKPSISLYGQLLWREFLYMVSTNNPNFDKMHDNPYCLQIQWRDDNCVEEDLQKWKLGQTGFPWIDAIMAQLRQEGWVHPMACYATACFLTRGALWISWEEGMKVFEEYLLDADWSVNAGNWMWYSCSAFSQHFYLPQCPVEFGKKLDENGDYIRKYLPILKGFSNEYIHEPWKAPCRVQKIARCMIGKDYPSPMFDQEEKRKQNMERIQKIIDSQQPSIEIQC
ncbi:cryptochrome-1-like isoform X2 [Actinia tenebrosa]|uniref:Cryptochrome-1-like isoform X2 n=1 Tax=Actinia tenebrosa TaxID=6105 RepID=A0A6P8HB67_ACTTE|nr:cryptochrome-1-like isoform X2 [Actinia tenebrosa]